MMVFHAQCSKLFSAVCSRTQASQTINVIRSVYPVIYDLFVLGAFIDKSICVPWLGATLLEAHAVDELGMPIEDFMQVWRESLPEAWRKEADIDLIKVSRQFRQIL